MKRNNQNLVGFALQVLKTISLVCCLVVVLALYSATNARADTTVTGSKVGGSDTTVTDAPNTLKNPLKVESIGQALNKFIEILSYVAVIVGVFMLVYTGFLFVMAMGNESKITKLKEQLLYIVIGLAIVIGARVIISVVLSTLEATNVVSPEVMNSAKQGINGK